MDQQPPKLGAHWEATAERPLTFEDSAQLRLMWLISEMEKLGLRELTIKRTDA